MTCAARRTPIGGHRRIARLKTPTTRWAVVGSHRPSSVSRANWPPTLGSCQATNELGQAADAGVAGGTVRSGAAGQSWSPYGARLDRRRPGILVAVAFGVLIVLQGLHDSVHALTGSQLGIDIVWSNLLHLVVVATPLAAWSRAGLCPARCFFGVRDHRWDPRAVLSGRARSVRQVLFVAVLWVPQSIGYAIYSGRTDARRCCSWPSRWRSRLQPGECSSVPAPAPAHTAQRPARPKPTQLPASRRRFRRPTKPSPARCADVLAHGSR